IHGEGISAESCLLDMGVETGLVEKAGSWYIYKGERIGQGRDNARIYLKENSDKAKELDLLLREKFLDSKGNVGEKKKTSAQKEKVGK
ncbi:MAG: DNA recombination/repair protein RecA, partial [Elusimicrobia bacterium]|nr:DNA recombination/repair protein RecA [Elusimicrobiota bacterium]